MVLVAAGPCYKCKAEMSMPDVLYHAAKHSAKISFFCAYGHEQIFAEGETDEAKLRRERDRLKQQLAQKDDEIAMQKHLKELAQKQAAALKAGAEKTRRRISRGVCPCCHRTFAQMARHMKMQHPDFKVEIVA